MNETYETKKTVADKIVLLGLFVVALLIAYLITASRSAIVLSEPIELNYAGLSVSIPSGNGWRSEKQWKFEENGFVLSSVFAPGAGRATALASCRYLLAAVETTPNTQFKQKASAIGGTIDETGETYINSLTVNWAHIKKQKTLSDMFFGTARLPNNRRCDIEVYQTAGDTNLTEQAFKRITESLKFKDNQLLEAGSEIIAGIKSKGLNYFLDKKSQQSFFLIKNAEGHTIGFTMDVLTTGQPAGEQPDIQAAGFLCLREHYAQEQATFFQSDNRFDEFTWKQEVSSRTGRSGTEIVLSKDGTMTVSKPGPQAKEKTYQPGPAAMPDVFLEQLFTQLLKSSREKNIVDMIEANGKITPTLISRIEAKEEAAVALKLQILDGRGFYEILYLDGKNHVSDGLLHYESTLLLKRTDAENILREFPEHADLILQKDKMLKQNQLQH